jgi:hypothetical protein
MFKINVYLDLSTTAWRTERKLHVHLMATPPQTCLIFQIIENSNIQNF